MSEPTLSYEQVQRLARVLVRKLDMMNALNAGGLPAERLSREQEAEVIIVDTMLVVEVGPEVLDRMEMTDRLLAPPVPAGMEHATLTAEWGPVTRPDPSREHEPHLTRRERRLARRGRRT